MQKITLKQGDLTPKLEATLTTGNPADPIDLTGCTVVLRYALRYLNIKFEVDATVLAPDTDGKVEYQWVPTDTDIVGTFDAEWIVTLPGGEPLTVPNDQAFELVITPQVGSQSYTLLHGGNQTQLLLRRLRARLADAERLLYVDDSVLGQALVDNFESFQFEAQSLADLFAPTALAYLATNPLNTTLALTRREQDIWVLITAREFLEAEVLEASRIAASLRSPAGQQNMTEVYKALRSCLMDVEAALDRKMAEDTAPLVFTDLTVSDAGRFIDDPGA